MKVAIIGDLHLPYSEYYPAHYFHKILKSLEKEKPELLLLTGDLCWGKKPYEVLRNLKPVLDLKIKRKIAVPGNHDNWFNLEIKRKYFSNESKLLILDGDWHKIITANNVNVGIVGIMGWFDYSFSNAQITPSPLDVLKVEKELRKLEIALKNVKNTRIKIVLMHYSPVRETVEGDPLMSKAGSERFFEVAKKFKVNYIFHSHTHTKVQRPFIEKEGILIFNTSAINLDFKPLFVNI